MLVPLLPTSPPVGARATAAGRAAAAAGDFAADLEALLAATSSAAAGLAAMLGLAAPAAATAQALPPAGATPSGTTTPTPLSDGALPTGALPSAALPSAALASPAIPTGSISPVSPILTVPTPPSPTGEDAAPISGLSPQADPGLQAAPTGEDVAPTSDPRPGAGAEPRPSSPAPGPGTERSAPVIERRPEIDPQLEVDVPPATVLPRHIEGPGPSRPTPEPAPLPTIPVRIAELTRRRTGVAEQIVVRLDPPELGTVRITVTARGDNVHVTLRADSPEARAALAAQRDSIETLLSGEGFDLSSFDVGYQRQGGGQSDTPRRGNGTLFSAAFEPAERPAPTAAADGALRL